MYFKLLTARKIIITIVSSIDLILNSIKNFIEIYLILISFKISLMWFPTINWYNEPFCSLNRLTKPYLQIFKGTIPMIYGIDISPMFSLISLQCCIIILNNTNIKIIR
uniref:Ycf19 n=1 Tax=Leachiella pacifica TaxID=282357 RepID=A0A3S8UVS0_9FLOR|nr:ycf19 [Leachiella pacifica]